jgi:hypothetical protein
MIIKKMNTEDQEKDHNVIAEDEEDAKESIF